MTGETVSGTNKKPGPDKSEVRKKAEAAGLSRKQMYRALWVARLPEEEFERLIESDDPPSVTEMARRGRGHTPERQGRRLKRCPHCGESLLREDTDAG